ncbi:MAG: ABC transporter substrate-binding protein [Candidatus Limnocylindrales bacterium]|nr:ABC transporter substrate-binding protein [Candidatus Limnocylindrales bacterium]
MSRLAFRLLAAGSLLALGLAAPAASRAQTLQIATDASPVGLDPHLATAFSTALITSTLYEGLTAIGDDLGVEPALAESWTVSPDGLTYLFKLRPGVRFHSGREMTAADVIASIERVRDPKTSSPLASRFAAIQGAEAVGTETVKLTLSTPSAPLLTQLAGLAIVPPESVASLGRKPDGTGPFKLTDWIPDTALVLGKNPAYWAAGLPHLDGLKFNIVPEAATREAGIAGGTYQLLPVVDGASAAALFGRPGVKLLSVQDLAYSLVGLNVSRPPLDKPEVREAFNLALDRPQIIEAAYYGRGAEGGPLSPALVQWALPASAFPCLHAAPAAARAKLAAAGLKTPVKITLNVLGSLQQVVDVAQVVQAQANKAGFDVTLNVQEQGRFIADWRASAFEGFVSLNSGGPDPDDYFGRTFATGGATNVFKYSNPEIDRQLAAARAEAQPAARREIYNQVQKALACTGPVVTLAYGTLYAAVSNGLEGFTPSPTRSLRSLREATLKK